MLRHALAICNGSGGAAGAGSPLGWSQNTIACGVRTADSWVPHVWMQAAYPPPRESCVRGADRAAVDKPPRPSRYAIFLPPRFIPLGAARVIANRLSGHEIRG